MTVEAPPSEAGSGPRFYPLSAAQRRLWFIERMNPESPLYNIAEPVRLRGPLDTAALERSLTEITRRHEILRTSFRVAGGNPIQVVAPARGFSPRLASYDASGEASAGTLVAAEVRRPFDLERGPLLRATLVRLAPEDHLFVPVMHHIVSDGWSLAIFFRELAALYRAFAAGQPSPLPELPIQYGDYAVWQQERAGGESLGLDLAYWRERLSGLPPLLELPTDRSRPPAQTFRGAVERRELPPGLTEALRGFCRREGVTLFMLLLAGFKVLLQRYTGGTDISVGAPVANRSRAEIENLIGFFVNTLVLRTNVSDDPTFRDLLGRVRQTVIEAQAHPDLPFERLVEELAPKRNLSYQPLFQVAMSIYEPAHLELDLPGLAVTPAPVETQTAKVDLTLLAIDQPGRVTLALEYATDLFEPSSATRLLGHLETLLEGAVADPARPVSRLPLLGKDEGHRLLVEWNATTRPFPESRRVHELFSEMAGRQPEALAVVFGDDTLTYAELDRRTDLLAAYLRGIGVGPETLVALRLERSPEMVVGLLGVLKAGGAYVPLDPALPRERAEFILKDTAATVLLTQEGLLPTTPGGGGEVICLDRDWKTIAESGRATGAEGASPGNLAYVIFTSGSTGQPKGVALEHQGLANLTEAQLLAFDRGPSDRVLQFASLSFDASIFEMVLAFRAGATLCIPRREEILPGPDLARFLRERRVTTIVVPPSALSALPQGDYPDLAVIIVAGEACPEEIVDLWAPGRRFWNAYGPTEITVWATVAECVAGSGKPMIGRPVTNVRVYVLDGALQPSPVGVPGELCVGGPGVARGYLGRADLTAERFIPDPFAPPPGGRLYRTGDLARYRADGSIEFLGRLDLQVKIRGFRIEPGEVEEVLRRHPSVQDVAVTVWESPPGEKRLVAYVAPATLATATVSSLREHLRDRLPEYMVPSAIVFLDSLPRTSSGKVDRKALPEPREEVLRSFFEAPRTAAEEAVAAAWRDVLHLERVGLGENFFDLGGHSLLLVQVQARLEKVFGRPIPIIEMFRHVTVEQLAAYLGGAAAASGARNETREEGAEPIAEGSGIAIIGMAGRFPGASDVEEFWRNVSQGRESITFFSEEELLAAGVAPALVRDSRYVKAQGLLEGPDLFDAGFFGYTPRDAEVMDPQHRVFLECAWSALENAGYRPDAAPGPVGVFAGQAFPVYLLECLLRDPGLGEAVGGLGLLIGSDKDFLATRVSYKLNLTGPSLSVQTACSSSLVAVHLACRSLADGECQMALAGGVRVHGLAKEGYLHVEGGILSPDGHCRAFDAGAAGTVPGDGLGVVVLRPLKDALAAGDHVYAVIKGSAVNNDGSAKVGYTAPSLDAQAAVVAAALAAARVDPATIGYIEAHGTGTPLGDPIEVAALRRAFGGATPWRASGGAAPRAPASCALGSVKTNIGHLDTAAGVAGLIKAALAIDRGLIPPSLHFENPNPEMNLSDGPFYVNTRPVEWVEENSPRRAGVSSFGIGGTNVHVVLEETPRPGPGRVGPAADGSGPGRLIVFSARSAPALEKATANLATALLGLPDGDLADVAYTLQVGRKPFAHRRAVVARGVRDAALALASLDPERVLTGRAGRPRLAFLFPGQGTQYVGMGRGLYETAPVFRTELKRCAELLEPHLGLDLIKLLYPAVPGPDLTETRLAQPVIFAVEWATAQLWLSWGVTPEAMLGHSVGEYVAACLAGVFSLEDALALVAARGRLIQDLPTGAMLAVDLGEEEITPLLGEVDLAAVNVSSGPGGQGLSTVSGPPEAVEALAERLTARGVRCRRLHTSHAFHSRMIEPALPAFASEIRRVRLSPPERPYLSNVTGAWIQDQEATDPDYWVRHMRETVRFAAGLRTLLASGASVLLEAGPGRTLATLAARQGASGGANGAAGPLVAVASLRHPQSAEPDEVFILGALGRLWLAGVSPDWSAYWRADEVRGGAGMRRRLPLPSYPFEGRRYWLGAGRAGGPGGGSEWGRPSVTEIASAGDGTPIAVASDSPAVYTGSPPAHGRPELPTPFVAPDGDLERAIAGVWEEVLGLSGLGVHDDLFELGGHSLMATQIAARLKQVFPVEFPLRKLFEGPTIAQVAEVIEDLLLSKLEAEEEGPDA